MLIAVLTELAGNQECSNDLACCLLQEFPEGFKGHWNLKYVDDDMRVFSTNKGNVFVLAKVDE